MNRPIRSAAVVSLVDPYPAESGKPVVLDGFLQFLAERWGAEHVHYLLVGGRTSDRGTFPVTLHELPGPTTRERLVGLARRGATARTSLQEALLSGPTVGEAVRSRLRELAVDLEIYDTMRVGQHAHDSPARRVCYLDDLHSERYRLMIDAMRRFPDVDMQPLGTFADQVPRGARPVARHRLGQRALLALERRTTRHSENRAARRFDTSLLVNANEAALLRRRAGVPAERVQAVPPLVRTPRRTTRTWDGAPQFVFLGLLTQPHNEDGLRSFLTETWPALLQRRPDACLRVIGRHPRPALREVAERAGGSVVLEGFVPDLDAALGGAAALVNPLRFGTGVKIKVIEALSRGLPVVSTAVGADGIASGPDTGVLVCDGVAPTVETLLRLTDRAQNRAASEAARAHHRRVYSRDAVFARYEQAFGLATDGPPAAAEPATPLCHPVRP